MTASKLTTISLKTALMTATLIGVGSANAHHGTSAHFDHDKDVYVEGVVSEMKFVNPHSYLYFEVASDDGTAMPWRCEMVEAGTLRRAGMTDEILAPGTIVSVHGKPARREAGVCYLEAVTLTDGTTISHRGQIGSGGEVFTPSAETQAIEITSSSSDTIVLASGGSEAENRQIVPVPTEGFFGYWSDGTRNAIGANARGARGGQGGGMAGAGQSANRGAGMAGTGQAARQGNAQNGATGTRQAAMGAGRTNANAEPRNPSPQYNASGKTLADKYDANYDNPALACSASILFGMGHHDLSNEFVKLSDDALRLTYGYMDMVRTIHIDGEFPASITPSVSGYSIGTWDGGALNVTTKGFAPGVFWAFAGAGNGVSTMNSDQLEFTERYVHDATTDTVLLEWSATDPGYWTAPLSGTKTMNRSTPYEVYGCVELAGENNLRASGETLFGVVPTSAGGKLGSSAATSQPKKSSVFAYITGAIILLGLALGFGLMRRRRNT